jgi:hypothetical protein
MKTFLIQLCVLGFLLIANTESHAALVLKPSEPKTYGQKTIIKMELQNTFSNKIESARAVVFLLNDEGKVVGQETRWILGGTKDRPGLEPNAKTDFHFVVPSDKPFTKTRITVTRLILEGGKLVNPSQEVRLGQITK